MERARLPLILLGLAGLWLATGCRRAPSEPPLPTDAVARVADQVISVEALQQELARRSRVSSGASNNSNQTRALLEDMIRFEVLYASALRAGYGQKPEVQAALKRLIVAQYRESLETNRPVPGQFSEADIADYYRRHAERYGTPEQVRAALIFSPLASTATPEKQAQVRQRAEAIRAQALAGAAGEATFALLAQTNSAHQPTRYRGGDLGWLTREAAARDWEPALVDALFGLRQAGQISPVVPGKDGLYLFKLVERKPASGRPLAEVRDAIAYHLARDQAAQQDQARYAQLKAGVDIRINEPALARLMTNVPSAPTPPRLPSQ